jgi:hypothetical protein
MAHGVLWLTGEAETGILNPDTLLPVLLYPAVLLSNQPSYAHEGCAAVCAQTGAQTVIARQQPTLVGRAYMVLPCFCTATVTCAGCLLSLTTPDSACMYADH